MTFEEFWQGQIMKVNREGAKEAWEASKRECERGEEEYLRAANADGKREGQEAMRERAARDVDDFEGLGNAPRTRSILSDRIRALEVE